MRKVVNRFLYDVPSLDLATYEPTQGYTTKSTIQKDGINNVMIDVFSLNPQSKAQAFFSQQSHNITWVDLKAVELILPRTKPTSPIMPFTLTPFFIGCSWIFGITPNNILVYHDRNPKDNYESKTEGILGLGATSIMRMDENSISDMLKKKFNVTSNWVYGVTPGDNSRVSSAFSYLRFDENMWKINIKDVWAVPDYPNPSYKYLFQEGCYQRTYDIA